MRTNKIDVSDGRVLSIQEREFFMDYFLRKNKRNKNVHLLFSSLCVLLFTFLLLGLLIFTIKNGISLQYMAGIVALAIAVTITIMWLKATLKGIPEYTELQSGNCVVLECICKEAVPSMNNNTNDPSLRCSLELKNGTMLRDKYFIAIKNIYSMPVNKAYKAYKANPGIMHNREMIVFYAPRARYAQLFDKKVIKNYCLPEEH